MSERRISEACFSDTGYSYTLSLIAGKYKPIVLYCLMEYEPVRFNEMRRYVGSAADKTLSQTLKELERDGLIHREMYPEIPPKVEYTLTERGHSLVQVLDQLCVWGEKNRQNPCETRPGDDKSNGTMQERRKNVSRIRERHAEARLWPDAPAEEGLYHQC